jgi:cell division septum initiation protein DivIVA
LEIHDRILKHDFLIGQIKDNLTLYQTVQEDLKTELNILNTNVAKLTVVVDSLRDTVKELKQK